MVGVPNLNVPICDPQTGSVNDAWQSFFQGLAGGAAAPERPVAPGPSPWTYKAPVAGHMIVQGGLTGLSLIRGRTPIAVSPTLAMIPLSAGDRLVLTFSAAPGLVFLPS